MQKVKSRYRTEIDGLRAFAVVSVIINHFNKDLLPCGFVGVDIFFVISGYVITLSMIGRKSNNFFHFLTQFYERRFKRLLPALVLFVLIASIVICLFNNDPNLSLRTGVSSLFGMSNLYLLWQSTDYFAESTELNPFTHTWSLGVEEQFYLLFPFLIWFSGFGQQKASGARNLFFSILFLSIVSLISFVYFYKVNQPASYFLMPPRFWEMGAGCLAFLILERSSTIKEQLEKFPPLLIVTTIVGIMFLPTSAAVFSIVSVVVFTVLLIACLKEGTAVSKIFSLRMVSYIGLISYSLYLWHWGVLSLSRWTIGITWWSLPFQLGLVFLISIASYRYVETPLRQASWSSESLLTIIECFAISAISSLGILSLSNISTSLLKVGDKLLPAGKFIDTGILQQRIYCHLPKNSLKAIPDCLEGTKKNFRSIYIVGDSHASNHFPSISRAASQLSSGIQVKVLVDWGFIRWLQGHDSCGYYSPCIADSGAKHLAFFAKNIRQGDIIVFSWFRSRVAVEKDRLPRRTDISNLSLLEQRLNLLASSVESRGGKIILVDDIPMICEPGINYRQFILRQERFDLCSMPEKVSLDDRKGLTQLYIRLYSSRPHVFLYYDPHPYLCARGVCDPFDRRTDGHAHLLYGDGIGHFRPEYPAPLQREWLTYLTKLFAENQPKSGIANISARN